MNTQELLDTARDAALRAGDILRKNFRKKFNVFSKAHAHDFVTDVDFAADKAIIDCIQQKFPTHNILSEEKGVIEGEKDAPTWVIDPLDGTFNFVRGIPHFATSIGVWQGTSSIAAVVYAPITDELFCALKGKGAFLNNEPIAVSTTKALADSVLATAIPYHSGDESKKIIDTFAKMLTLGCAVRDFGSCAIDLCYLAAGRLDGYWMPHVHAWDFAAGKHIIEEAGGTVSLFTGKAVSKLKTSPIVASNGHIHKSLLEKLRA